jgi:hypothetical protein
LGEALSLIVSVLAFAPCDFGEKVTLMVQFAPAATLVPQLEVTPNWAEAFMDEILSAVSPVLVKVTLWAVLLAPTACFPKASGVVGEKATTPVLSSTTTLLKPKSVIARSGLVAIEIPYGHEAGFRDRLIRGAGFLEGAIADTRENGRPAVPPRADDHVVCYHEIELSIAREVGGGDRISKGKRIIDRLLKGAIALAQQYAERAAFAVGDGQVELVIAIEVGYGNRFGGLSAGIACAVFKCAVAIAQPNIYSEIAGRHHIKRSVAVEVADGHRFHCEGWLRAKCLLKCTVAVAEHHADALAGIVKRQGYQVWLAVVVEVPSEYKVVGSEDWRVLWAWPERPVAVSQ